MVISPKSSHCTKRRCEVLAARSELHQVSRFGVSLTSHFLRSANSRVAESYLHYIRRQNPIPPAGSANAANADGIRETVKRAYELALNETGNDIDSGVIWKEYIAFLDEKEASLSGQLGFLAC